MMRTTMMMEKNTKRKRRKRLTFFGWLPHVEYQLLY